MTLRTPTEIKNCSPHHRKQEGRCNFQNFQKTLHRTGRWQSQANISLNLNVLWQCERNQVRATAHALWTLLSLPSLLLPYLLQGMFSITHLMAQKE